MDSDILQAETIFAQIKIAKIYSELIETINLRYLERKNNAITENFKIQLIKTAESLNQLNRLQDEELKFYIGCTREGISLLQTTAYKLDEMAKSVSDMTMGIIMAYRGDVSASIQRISDSKERYLNNAPSSEWYLNIVKLKKFARTVNINTLKLTKLQTFIFSNFQKFGWRFCYAGALSLYEFCRDDNLELAKQAFSGHNFSADKNGFIPGLNYYVSLNILSKYWSEKNIRSLSFSKTDPNPRIRKLCATLLGTLKKEAKHDEIKKNSAELISHRLSYETDQLTREYLIKARDS